MNGRLVVLAGGIGARMKQPSADNSTLDVDTLREAREKSKAMISVGAEHRPFLDYLLFHAYQAGYRDVVLVINPQDRLIRDHCGPKDRENHFHGLSISYVNQSIPKGRAKPLGTAEALFQALQERGDWKGQQFTVCNSDNLYSVEAFQQLLKTEYAHATIEYDQEALDFSEERIAKFAIMETDEAGYLTALIEKPSLEQIRQIRKAAGRVGVSMNIFTFTYDKILPLLPTVPLHPTRREQELPIAVQLLIDEQPGVMMTYPRSEHVPDLTSPKDILTIRDQIETWQGPIWT